ncbi:alkanesulfonate monooxygenase [Brachybacterium ginsengisoli]|uniref:Alkanesulfonate monooxygenase n=1 Tax=Brachybacterium ginsengisoli TaxID=1331682 RepID=A0A291GZK3_9MICO|nr:LLM class flavin-dependent oxidoreductase [Brachybacterium ginsengisoli]ATG55658.1 alkanesulfonate monooxygenase [Brachybacterium ginsengisoli]
MTDPTPSPRFHWFLPPRGDAMAPMSVAAENAAPAEAATLLDFQTEVARAAEDAGFAGVLTPVGINCPDPWLVCSAVAARTSTLSFIVALRPSLASATLIAQQADTFRRLHGGRLILNIVTGGNPAEQAGYGVHVPHDERYEITDESLQAIRPLLDGEKVELEGRHLHLVGAQLPEPTTQPVPIFFGGASPKAVQVAAEQADTYLLWGEPLADIAARIGTVREAAAAAGRTLSFGLRIHVISRDTSEQAWQAAADLQATFDPESVAAVRAHKAAMDSVGQARMDALHGARLPREVQDLVIGPNLWSGIGLLREGVGTALVGSHDEVADRLLEYADLGIDEFILSSFPHREEALRVGREVLPRVRERAAVGV